MLTINIISVTIKLTKLMRFGGVYMFKLTSKKITILVVFLSVFVILSVYADIRTEYYQNHDCEYWGIGVNIRTNTYEPTYEESLVIGDRKHFRPNMTINVFEFKNNYSSGMSTPIELTKLESCILRDLTRLVIRPGYKAENSLITISSHITRNETVRSEYSP